VNLKRATSVAFFALTTFALGHAGIGLAQEAVYRCGQVITNDAAQAKREKCQLLESGAVVTIPSAQKAVAVTQNSHASLNKASSLKPRQATAAKSLEQNARDADAKAIIESELKKTETQLVDWRKQYAGLSAEQDIEKKLALKQQIARGEADVISLKRELKR
jgi:LAS superfamily LD-carboxypeptidase LdcB